MPAGRSSSSPTGETGVVAEPTPEAIAARHRRPLGAARRRACAEMGEAGRARVADITWDHVIDRLTESIALTRLAVVEPAAALALGDRRLRGGEPPRPRPPSSTWSTVRRGSGHDRRRSADLDLYHLGNSPAHAFVYRAARARPGVAVLHDWSLHHLVLHETVERGDVAGYLREMRRAYGETGDLRRPPGGAGAGRRPAARALPAQRPRARGSLGVVALTRATAARVAPRACPAGPASTSAITSRCPSIRCPRARRPGARSASPRTRFVVTAPGPGHRHQAARRGRARRGALPRRASRRCGSWWRARPDPRLPLAGLGRDAGPRRRARA